MENGRRWGGVWVDCGGQRVMHKTRAKAQKWGTSVGSNLMLSLGSGKDITSGTKKCGN